MTLEALEWGALLAAGAAVVRFARPFMSWVTTLLGSARTRQLTLEQEIALLRVAFDKSRRRENGYATVCELLILGLEVEEDERPLFIKRAREVLNATLKQGGD